MRAAVAHPASLAAVCPPPGCGRDMNQATSQDVFVGPYLDDPEARCAALCCTMLRRAALGCAAVCASLLLRAPAARVRRPPAMPRRLPSLARSHRPAPPMLHPALPPGARQVLQVLLRHDRRLPGAWVVRDAKGLWVGGRWAPGSRLQAAARAGLAQRKGSVRTQAPGHPSYRNPERLGSTAAAAFIDAALPPPPPPPQAFPICLPGTAVWRARKGRMYIFEVLQVRNTCIRRMQ